MKTKHSFDHDDEIEADVNSVQRNEMESNLAMVESSMAAVLSPNYSSIPSSSMSTTSLISTDDNVVKTVETATTCTKTSVIPFTRGDHVYHWCDLMGLPCIYQHHAIVLDVYWNYDASFWVLKLADFSNPEGFSSTSIQSSSELSTSTDPTNNKGGLIRIFEWNWHVGDENKLHKVQYEADWVQRFLWRSGTCTVVSSDPIDIVLARVQFLIGRPSLVPEYSTVHSNCECVAVWCKTGSWSTLQAASLLHLTIAGQVKTTVTGASIVAASTVTTTVPAAGFWGWMGYTTTSTVSLAVAQPWLIPTIATVGIITTAIPAIILLQAHGCWKKVTQELNDEFMKENLRHERDVQMTELENLLLSVVEQPEEGKKEEASSIPFAESILVR